MELVFLLMIIRAESPDIYGTPLPCEVEYGSRIIKKKICPMSLDDCVIRATSMNAENGPYRYYCMGAFMKRPETF
jgi:hypothetical protein